MKLRGPAALVFFCIMLMLLSLVYLVILEGVAHARPPAGGPTPEAEWFKALKQPGTGGSCCDLSDCARMREEDYRSTGETWAFRFTTQSFTMYPDADGKWYEIPENKFTMPRDEQGRPMGNPTGTLVVCGRPGGMVGFMLFCAVKPFQS